ncbi:MAG TPA: hypothetical protein VLF21_00160 [Candidatus Saccharimonadales bacterium]|nr:hypothetical protein [Candidatus Saccharimonadales bacterium]
MSQIKEQVEVPVQFAESGREFRIGEEPILVKFNRQAFGQFIGRLRRADNFTVIHGNAPREQYPYHEQNAYCVVSVQVQVTDWLNAGTKIYYVVHAAGPRGSIRLRLTFSEDDKELEEATIDFR